MEYAALEKLYTESGMVTLHCPLNQKTYYLVEGTAIKLMKRHADQPQWGRDN